MSTPLITEASCTLACEYKSGFERFLTGLSRVTLITNIACTFIGGGLYLALNYFESSFDDFDDHPNHLTQKSFKLLSDLSWVTLSAAFYVGLQGVILSQILNIGYYLLHGRGAIHYRHVFSL